ncbi:hypothetical protein [Microbacterium luticocti]|uniref:hypothetical protein n=1 Tax=Microbacterium luticocti TaxID=451764 RepID=UPI00040BB216|nr:hypothetical protein [Microbacterium luticocti]
MSSTPELAPRGSFGGIVAVWVAAALIGTAIAVFAAPGQRAVWLAIGMAGCLVLAFAVQLWVGRPHRFIARVAFSTLGALVVLGLISAGLGLAALVPA